MTRTQAHSSKLFPNISSALAHFDELPDSAYVSVDVVSGVQGCSVATTWRRAKDGQIPPPVKLGKRTTRWRVGDLRQALSEAASRDANRGEKA